MSTMRQNALIDAANFIIYGKRISKFGVVILTDGAGRFKLNLHSSYQDDLDRTIEIVQEKSLGLFLGMEPKDWTGIDNDHHIRDLLILAGHYSFWYDWTIGMGDDVA